MRNEWPLKQLSPVHNQLGVFEASCWSESDIPPDWELKGTLVRSGLPGEVHRHRFYDLRAGRIAIVFEHSCLGEDALMVRVGPAAWARDRWKALLAAGSIVAG
ncbi:hypothetical protein S2L_28 [Cyanophage S-2L]|nr:hypothetical protein S2L_28 [Cyanophage S-2L]